jgi:PST family polysaccharide transporter
MSLAKKAAHGLAWVALSNFITRILDFITKLILARLLLPSDFGLVAIGLLVVNTLRLFQNLGFEAALIYRKDDKEYKAANTAFILILITGTILFVLAYFSSPIVAMIFNNATVEPVVKVLAFTFIIFSFGAVPSTLLEKELEFKKKVLPETLAVLGHAAVAITLAILGYGVWSLVFGQVASSIISVVLIWIVSDWRPTFTFDMRVARELFDYGKYIVGASVVIFLVTNIDDAFVGRMLGMSALGFYTVAYMIANLPATQVTHLVGRVMFPTYSKLQTMEYVLKETYIRTFQLVTFISIPISGFIFILAPEIVIVLLGDKWMPMVPALRVLCVFGATRSFRATFGPVFQAAGKPIIITRLASINLVLMLVIIYPLTLKLGILGAAIAVVVPILVTSIPAIKEIVSISKISPLKFSRLLLFPISGTVIMMSILLVSKTFILVVSSLGMLLLQVGIGILCYLIASYMFDGFFKYDLTGLRKYVRESV